VSFAAVRQRAEEFVDSGAFAAEPATMVAYPTESHTEAGRIAARAYLYHLIRPAMERRHYPASRTPLDDPWVEWAKRTLEQVTSRPVALLPNIGGGLPNHVFTDILGLPTLWLPHSYPGCRQHAPDEHLLASIAREGIVLAAALFHELGGPSTPFSG
jgi:hypothetical protein